MAYVFVADDFTGASDTLATLARSGLRARLFRDVPTPAERDGLEAWGIATDARSLNNPEIAALATRIGAGLAKAAPDFLHVKICSTFDSSVSVGNVALLAQGLADAMGITDIAVLAGQPSLGRYAVFGTLFARGPDGQVHRIDRHPVMAVHPVTPMHEADLVRHLATLGLGGVQRVGRGQAGGAFPRLYDLLDQADVAYAGADLAMSERPVVVLGASSVAEAWLAGQASRALITPSPIAAKGPILAFAGSRSSLTAAQVAAADGMFRLPMAPAMLLARGAGLDVALSATVERLSQGQDCLVHLVEGHHLPIAPAALAQAGAAFVAHVHATVRLAGLIVAGGDTSSAVVNALRPDWLEYAGPLCAGVPVLRAKVQGDTMLLALKGGQMGDTDFFGRAVAALRGG